MATGQPSQLGCQAGSVLSPETLHDAVHRGNLDAVKKLVGSGADLGARDAKELTPLMCAVALAYEDIAEFLAKQMTVQDLESIDKDGHNVIHMMALFDLPWQRLLHYISNTCPNLLQKKDLSGKRPIDTARKRQPKNQGVIQILEQLQQQQEQREKQTQQHQQFTAGIADNVENPCNITITVVGHKGVGKTCFVRQLKQERIPDGGPGATDTADFYVNFLGYNPNTGHRQPLNEYEEMHTGRQRLRRIISRHLEENEEFQQEGMRKQHSSDPSSEVQQEGIPQEQIRNNSSEKKVHKELSHEQRSTIEAIICIEKDGDDAKEVKGYVTIYDFGGENVFYNTHHCFMSSNMVFVLVFDVAMCLDKDKSRSRDGYERIEFWLRSIATYAIDKAAHEKGTPPIIIVGSHMDLVSPNKEEQQRLFDNVIIQLCEDLEIHEIIKTHVKEMFPIAHLDISSKNHCTYLSVWNKIIEVAPLQSQWMKPVPARWVALEHELVRLKKEEKVILTYADLLEMNNDLAVALSTNDIAPFLWKLKFCGSFLCFDLYSKAPFIVLRAQWIINAFKAIVTDTKFTTNLTAKQRLEWSDYEKSGILPIHFLRQLWGQVKENKFLENEEALCITMETLGLLSKPLSVDADVDYFIVPSILQPADPEIICPVLADPDTVTTVTLCVKFNNPFIPQAVWDKMIASCIHRFQRLKELGHDGLEFIRRGFACLYVDCLWNMIIHCSGNVMKVTMFKKDIDHSIPRGTGIALLNILEFLLKQILELNHQSHLEYQFYLHNDFRFSVDDRMVKVDDLREHKHLRCFGLKGPGWIYRDDLYIWFEDPNHQVKRVHDRCVDMTKILPDRTLSFKEIGRLSKYIGKTYQTFFVDLGCPMALVEQEMEEHQHLSFRSRIAKIFIHLIKTKPGTGFMAIADAMSRHGMDTTLLVSILDSNRKLKFKDKTIKESSLQQCLSIDNAPIIADHVDIKAYFNLFLELGFSPAKIDDFDDQYKKEGTRVKVTAMLKAVIDKTNPRPTVKTILLAMQECDMDIQSLITAVTLR